jgi:coenzyme F420 hydrogenase subunit beta
MRRDALPPLVAAAKVGASAAAPQRALCTDCGLSRASDPHRCAHACRFIRPDYPQAQARTHGRARGLKRLAVVGIPCSPT